MTARPPHRFRLAHWALMCAGAAAWSCVVLVVRSDVGVVWFLPPLYAAGLLLQWRWPALGALAVAAVQAASLTFAGAEDNPVGLAAGLLAVAVAGLRLPMPHAAAVLVVFCTVIIATGLPMARTLLGFALFAAVALLGRGIGRNRLRLSAARDHERQWVERDLEVTAQAVVAEERQRMALDAVSLVKQSVTDMREGARAMFDSTIAPQNVALLHAQGSRAVDDLRRLLTLLRADAAQPPLMSSPRPTRPVLAGAVTAVWAAVIGAAEVAGLGSSEARAVTWLAILATVAPLVMHHRAPLLAGIWLSGAMVGVATAGWTFAPSIAIHLAAAVVMWSSAYGPLCGRRVAVGVLELGAMTYFGSVHSTTDAAVALGVGIVALTGGQGWWQLVNRRDVSLARVRGLRDRLDTQVNIAMAAEQRSLARELHDVTSHALGVMLLQCGAAAVMARSDQERARHALAAVDAAGADALVELDQMIVALGGLAAEPPAAEDRVQALIERIRRTGASVKVAGRERLPDGPRGDVAYRFLQEALTNAVRHAPGAWVEIAITPPTPAAGTTITVITGAPTAAASSAGSGVGLAGLRERLDQLGGTLSAQPTTDGGFTAQARFPPLAD